MLQKEFKRLPSGVSDFRKLREKKLIYVDKTRLIYQMATSDEYYFCSRPRRFGKSLLVSTLGQLFAGNKNLFSGLWIENSDYTWEKHPIIHFDFSIIGHRTVHDLITNINVRLDAIADDYNIDVDKFPTIDSKFQALIERLAQINKVVILIDEYDKPIVDHIVEPEQARAQREVLKGLYCVIKGSDQHLRFVLLTGVSKFSKASVFSGINNLIDISMDTRYATMFGYTQQELELYFQPHLEQFALAQNKTYQEILKDMTNYYNGYQFAEHSDRVFNPFSVLLCLGAKKLDSYWFETGTPSFLIQLLQNHDYDLESITQPVLNKVNLGSFEPDNIPLPSLLFQTGYLTIKNYDPRTNNYTLGIPNREVHIGLTAQLVDAFTRWPANKSIQYARLLTHAFATNNMAELHERLQEFFNRMPYTVHINSEHSLQFVLYAIFALIGVSVDPEVTTSIGRADLVVTFPKHVYIIELKFNQSADKALEQIQDKRYYEKYLGAKKHITLLGLGFDHKSKAINARWQEIAQH